MPARRSRSLVRRLSLLLLLALAATLPLPATGQIGAPFTLGGDRRVDPNDFEITVFAAGLSFPYGMTELPDGSLLVGSSVPSGDFFGSTGDLIRLVDADGDGVADDAGQVLATGLPGALTAVRRAGTLIFAVSSKPAFSSIHVLRLGDDATAPLTWFGAFEFFYHQQMDHGTYEVATRPVPDRPDQFELYFNVGSLANAAAGAEVTLRGLVEATLTDASIYRLVIDDSGAEPAFSPPELIATGLRNAAGLALHPESGDLYIADNGIDTPEDRIVALSADELNVIPAARLGGAVEDFGFPDAYVDYQSGERVGEGGLPPLVAFSPVAGSENEGSVQIALAPAAFPTGLDDGVFVGFHGQWDEVGLDNEENPLVYVDLASGDYFQIIANDEPAIGHLDGLLATANALYLADFTGPTSMLDPTPSGVIYRIAPAE